MAHTKVTKTGTQNTGTANTFSYSGSFNVFKASEVEVELDNVKLTFTTSTINESASPREYTVDYSAKTIHIGGADLAGTNSVTIQPVTDMGAPTPRATYSPGSSVTSDDLNNNQLQLMRKAMEYDEQKLSSRGGTMTGNLHFAKDIDITFEGDTDNAYETTLTVADPTSDKTITLPDTTGTVVTTGDTGTVTATMLAANSVDSSELVDGSIDTSHIGNSQVTTDKIAADAVTGAKIADDAINSEHYTDGSIDTAHIADSQVTTAKIAADAITGAKIADDAVDSEHLAADSIDAEHYAAGSVDTTAIASSAVTTAKIADDAVTNAKVANNAVDADQIVSSAVTTAKINNDAVTNAKLADNAVDVAQLVSSSVTTVKINDGAVTTAKLGADAVTGAKIADDAIDSEHYAADSIDSEHYAAASVDDTALASNSVTTSKITDANVTTAKLAADSVTIAKIGCEQTTISNSDSHIPTSGAVVDYVAAQIAPIGGLEVIADEDNFPTSQPSSGVVISISDAAGIVVNGSGVSTTARTAGNGSDNVTINNFPSSLYGETLASGVGLMVSSTGSSQTYNYHKILAAETDVKQLSDDINDFNARYRVASSAPSSSLDEGDLWWDSATDKLKVYDGSSWEEVASSGDFYINTISSYSGTGGNSATFNGSAYRFVLSNPGSYAQQHIVSINGVIQKPNSGTSQPSEGFVIDGSSIIFSNAPATGSDYFILTLGTTVSIGTPSDGTVTAAKIASGAVETAKIADAAVTTAKIAKPIDLADNEKIRLGTGNDLEVFHDGSHSYIKDTGTGRLILQSSQLCLQSTTGENLLVGNPDGATELYHDNTKKFETTSYGGIFGDETSSSVASPVRLSLGGTFHSSAGADPKLSLWTDGTDHMGFGVSSNRLDVILTKDQYDFVVYGGADGTTERFRVHGDGTGIELPDSSKAIFGDGSDLQIYHDGSHSYIANTTGTLLLQNSGQTTVKGSTVQFENAAGTEVLLKAVQDGAVELYYDNTKRFETTSNGGTLTGSFTLTSHLLMGDGDKIKLGDSNDLEFHHSSGENYIQGHTNQLYIRSAQGIYIQPNTNENGVVALANGAVNLYHDNVKKFETRSDGVTVQSSGSSQGINVKHSNGNVVASMHNKGSGDEGYLTLYDAGEVPTIQLDAEHGRITATSIRLHTNNAANELDDYEEGTFTPGIDKNASSVQSVSYSHNSGVYTKIGNLVTFWFDLDVSANGNTGSGVPYVTGLPFTATTGSASNGGYGAPQFRNMTLLHGDMREYSNSSYIHQAAIFLYHHNSAGTETASSTNGTGRITGQGFYYTTS